MSYLAVNMNIDPKCGSAIVGLFWQNESLERVDWVYIQMVILMGNMVFVSIKLGGWNPHPYLDARFLPRTDRMEFVNGPSGSSTM